MRAGVFGQLHRFTKGHHPQALRVVGLGLLLAMWDVTVPLGSGYVMTMILHHDPTSTVLASLALLFVVGWLPHGNLLPYLLECYDLQHYRVPMLARLSICAIRASAGVSNGCRKQPIVQQGRDNIARLAERCARELPMALRGVIVFIALLIISRMFAPILLLSCILVVAITVYEFYALDPAYKARQQAENIQRDLENEIDDAKTATMSDDELRDLLDAHEIAVLVRADLEIEVGRRDITYELARRVVFNVAMASIWAWAAVGVIEWGYSPVAFLAVTQYVARVNELFGSILGVVVETLRIGASVDYLDRLLDTRHGTMYKAVIPDPRQGDKNHEHDPDRRRIRPSRPPPGAGADLLQGGRGPQHQPLLRCRVARLGRMV
jgi:ABC-type multidrug transport system fused ATPase/permease subunit